MFLILANTVLSAFESFADLMNGCTLVIKKLITMATKKPHGISSVPSIMREKSVLTLCQIFGLSHSLFNAKSFPLSLSNSVNTEEKTTLRQNLSSPTPPRE